MVIVFFFKQRTAYEMRISDWSSDVCSSDLWRCADADRADACVGDPNLTARAAKQLHQCIARRDRSSAGTGMAATASTIQFARGDARDADAWTLGTPDRAIAIGDKGGRAEEYQPCGHDTHVAMESFLRLPRPRRTVGCRPRPIFFASSRRCSA